MRIGRGLREALWAGALVSLGALSLAAAWGHWLAALTLVIVALLPMGLLRQAIRLGVSRWAAVAVLALLLVLTAYLLAADTGLPLAATVTDAVPRLLTEPLPLTLRPDLLVAPVLAVGTVSLLVGLRLHSRTRAAPVAAGFALYVAAALLTGGDGDPSGLFAALLLATSFLGWVLLDDHDEPGRRRVVVAGPLGAVAVGIVAALAVVPVAEPFDARELVEPPLVRVEGVSPLPRLGAWAANPDVELLRVRGRAVPLRLVTLEDFDGSAWSTSTSFAPFGSYDDRALPAGEFTDSATLDVEVLDLGGNWVPSPGRPTAVDERRVLVDPATGTLFDPEAEAEAGYRLTATYDVAAPAALPGASVPTGPAIERYLALPDLPFALATYANRVTQGAATPYERALAIETAVRADRSLSSQAISGSAYWRLEAFLLGDEGTPGARVGTSEQFAAAFAVIARHNGLPARVVVGFAAGDEQPDGSRLVRGDDAFAWPEIYFERIGWVPFSPTPDNDTFLRDRPERTEIPQESEVPAPAPDAEAGAEPGPTPARPETGDARGGDDGPATRVPWLLAAFGAPFLALLLLRRLRSARHRRAGAPGAWAEVVDGLRLAGLRPAPQRPAALVAEDVAERFGTPAPLVVATAAERSAFGPDAPAPGAVLVAEVTEVRRAVRRSVPAWRRWWWAFDPRVWRG